jgi:hypothetical protein
MFLPAFCVHVYPISSSFSSLLPFTSSQLLPFSFFLSFSSNLNQTLARSKYIRASKLPCYISVTFSSSPMYDETGRLNSKKDISLVYHVLVHKLSALAVRCIYPPFPRIQYSALLNLVDEQFFLINTRFTH